jgi:methionine-rich copper-binding protein CopC
MHRIILQRWYVGAISALAGLLALAWPLAAAQAHAAYKSSVPAANSIVKTVPTSVTITFLQPLDPSHLSIVVYDNKAQVVSTGAAQIITGKPDTATVAIKGDGSDIYRVDWNNVSAQDGDPTLGAFVFGVGDTDKVTSPPPSITAGSTGVPVWLVALIGVIGLIVGYGASFVVKPGNAAAK